MTATIEGAGAGLERSLQDFDPAVAAAIGAELDRRRSTLEMVASENFAPGAVLPAQGPVLTTKYAEGYPGRRYHGGCEHVDVLETPALDPVANPTGRRRTRAAADRPAGTRFRRGCRRIGNERHSKALFGAQFANVQPQSGAQANAAAMAALTGRFPLYPHLGAAR